MDEEGWRDKLFPEGIEVLDVEAEILLIEVWIDKGGKKTLIQIVAQVRDTRVGVLLGWVWLAAKEQPPCLSKSQVAFHLIDLITFFTFLTVQL